MVEFSVIIPAYNVVKYVPLALKSLIEQTYKDFEIICVEDCSTDKTLAMLQLFAKLEPRIKIIRNNTHLGPGTSRNIALKMAKGKYISCVDADDVVDKTFLEEAYQKLETENVSSVWVKADIYWQEEKRVTKMNTFPKLRDLPEGKLKISGKNICDFPAYSWYKFYKRESIDDSIKWADGHLFEDVEFYYRYYTQNPDVYVIDKPLYLYRRHSSSIMGRSIHDSAYQRDLFTIIHHIYLFLKEKNLFKKYKKAFLTFVKDSILDFEGYPDIKDALEKTVLETLDKIGYPQEYEDLAKKLPSLD